MGIPSIIIFATSSIKIIISVYALFKEWVLLAEPISIIEVLPFSIRFYKAEVSRSFGGLEPLHRPMRQEEINPLGFIMLLDKLWAQHLSVYMAVL